MKRRVLSIVFLVLFLIFPYSIASLHTPDVRNGLFELPMETTIYVDNSNTHGPWDGSYDHPYQHIHNGVLHAEDGDTIYVFNGLYLENVWINKSISLLGQSQENTIIDGQNNGSVVTVATDNVLIRRFTMRNSGGYHGDAGVTVVADSATITECLLFRTRAGISADNTSDTVIASSRFHTNGFGIYFSRSAFVTIDSCVWYHNGIGAYFTGTRLINITNSYADTNGIGFLFERSFNIRISRSAARDNDDNEGGMFFTDCSYVSVINCNLNHNGVGMKLANSSNCFVDRCNFSYNTHFAIRLKKAVSSIFLTNCIFTKNLRFGIHAENSACTISWCNVFNNNNYGLYAKESAITAGYNWWGSKRGPAYTGLTRADRCSLNPRKITYAPWLTFPMPDIGPDWDLDKTFEKPMYDDPWPQQITFSEPDLDGDGAPDWWELKWGYNQAVWDDHYHLDPDNDSLHNIEECSMDHYGSNPFRKDVFVEFDWTTSTIPNTTNKPPVTEISQMIEAFAQHNITLHVDTGQLGGGEEIPSRAYVSYAEIINLYWDYFLHNDLNNPRPRIFRYGIICEYTEASGFAVIGWDHLNSFIIGAQFLTERYRHYTRGWLLTTASMHEIGHTFGLIITKFDGIDNTLAKKPSHREFWTYCSYKSILNYLYTFSFMDFSDGSNGRGDYDDWGNLDFSFFKNTSFRYPL